jgi:pyochelin synthetase
MIPSRTEIVDALPLTENGKIDRRALDSWVAPAHLHQAGRPAADAPLSGPEREVAAIWAEVLRVPAVGRDDDFYALGGDSLLAAQVVTEVRERVAGAEGVFFDEMLRELLNGASVADLAGMIGEPGGGADVPGPAGGRLAIVGDPSGAPVVALVLDGLGRSADQLAAGLADRGPVVAVPCLDLDLAADDVASLHSELERAADDTAAELCRLAPGPFQVVGAHAGAVLAVEVARRLVEAGAEVADLAVVSAVPPPAAVTDDLLAEYLHALDLGVDPTGLGYPAAPVMSRALAAVPGGPGSEPGRHAGASPRAHSGGDPIAAEIAAFWPVLGAVPRDERLRRLAAAAAAEVDAVATGLARARALDRAVAGFPVAPYAGDVTVLRHTVETPVWPRLREQVLRYWADVGLGDVRAVDVPGDHYTCRAAPGLAELVGGARAAGR